MLLKDVLKLFRDETSDYISSISYYDSKDSFELELEEYDKDGDYYKAVVVLFEDGDTLIEICETEDSCASDGLYISDGLINAYVEIRKVWTCSRLFSSIKE